MDTELAGLLVMLAAADEYGPIHGRDTTEIMAQLDPLTGPQRILDLSLRIGPYGDGFGADRDGLSLAKLLENPHGIDLGALESRIPEMLRTRSGRIDLANPAFVGDLARLRDRLAEGRAPLVLIGRRHLRSNNSWQHNIGTLMKGGQRCVLQIHPGDAERIGLAEGDTARISSAIATIEAPVEVTDAVMAGVVSLPHGWGHDLPGARLSLAAQRPGVNSNRLASNDRIDPLSGNPHLNGIPVEVTRLGERA
jgi:hypothetical protein